MNGVGGRTIAEAQRNMTQQEFKKWILFRNKRGSIFTGRRVEQAIGNWMAHYSRYKVKEGVEVDAFDFMPHEEAPVLTYEEERLRARKREST